MTRCRLSIDRAVVYRGEGPDHVILFAQVPDPMGRDPYLELHFEALAGQGAQYVRRVLGLNPTRYGTSSVCEYDAALKVVAHFFGPGQRRCQCGQSVCAEEATQRGYQVYGRRRRPILSLQERQAVEEIDREDSDAGPIAQKR